ncbi:hypothetical protein CRM22_000734, partial [Opisthorchis felineus]
VMIIVSTMMMMMMMVMKMAIKTAATLLTCFGISCPEHPTCVHHILVPNTSDISCIGSQVPAKSVNLEERKINGRE